MRIALVSYEYDGAASGGGIGTYTRAAAAMLHSAGYSVEVFVGGGSALPCDEPWASHRVGAQREEFSEAVVPVFAARHAVAPFDIVEGPEYGADAAGIAKRFPEIALVVKLHAPSFTIQASNAKHISRRTRLRFALGALRRGRWPRPAWRYDPLADPERRHALGADEVAANSAATAARVAEEWQLPADRLSVVPLPFTPPAELLDIPIDTATNTVLFLGRVEVRKGVLDLARAIPIALAAVPELRFRFVGRILPHPDDHRSLQAHIHQLAGPHAARVEMTGGVDHAQIAEALAASDICVLPSDWEAAGFTCLEAMAAGRGVIASSAGGMAEVIEHDQTGLLIAPGNPRQLARAIIRLARDAQQRGEMGRRAREAIRTMRTPDAILPLQIASYRSAIERAATRQRHAHRDLT